MISIIAGFVAYLIGIFAMCNIILPVFFSWPLSVKLHNEGKLLRPIPVGQLLVPPIMWSGILYGIIYAIHTFIPNALTGSCIGLSIATLIVIRQLFNDNKDMYEDFYNTWKEYII